MSFLKVSFILNPAPASLIFPLPFTETPLVMEEHWLLPCVPENN